MEKRILGRTGLPVTVLGFGGAEIGFQNASQDEVTRLLNSAIDAGLNVIDTAAMYLASEQLIGNAVGHRRQELVLMTKCGHPAHPETRFSRSALQADIDNSLRALKTDHVDLLQLHSCSEELLRQGEVIDVVEAARAAGKTRFIGYSGEEGAARYAISTGRFDTLQISVNLCDQNVIDDILPAAVAANMGVIAKRPIANAVWLYESLPENAYIQPYWHRLQALRFPELADRSQAAAVALRFTLSVPGVSTLIVGTRTPGRWQQNAQIAAQGPLPPEVFASLRNRWKQHVQPDWTGQV
jgi:aryl-alcohol dehydrogenase-like predicted oxidoreductase